VTVPVLLKAGLNAIRFANATAPLPDMDAIRIDLNAAPAPVGLAAPLSRDAAGVRLLPRGRDGLLLETDVEFSDLRILDLSGKELWTGSDKRIPTGFLRPGLYLLAIRAHQGAFVKEFTRL
jgi:hypothetical protein